VEARRVLQYVGKIVGYRTHKTDSEIFGTVEADDVAVEEEVKLRQYEIPENIVADVVVDERHKARQKLSRGLAAIHSVYHIVVPYHTLTLKHLAVRIGNFALVDGVDETLADACAAALVAEDVAHRRYVFGDVALDVNTRIAAGAKYCRDAVVSLEQSTPRSHKVAECVDFCGGEYLGKHAPHLVGCVAANTSRSVKKYFIYRAGIYIACNSLTYCLSHRLYSSMDGVEPVAGEDVGIIAVRHCPIAFGSPAICYEEHIIFAH